MFNIFSKRSSGSQSLRTILRLDTLDGRYAPSDLFGNEFVPNVPFDGSNEVLSGENNGSGGATTTSGANRAGNNNNLPPVISISEVNIIAPGYVRISGKVVDENPAGLTVNFSSTTIPAINGRTATTDANGNYTITVYIGVGTRGDFWVQTTDAQGLESNLADDFIP